MRYFVGVRTNAGRGYVEHATTDREHPPALRDTVATLCGSRVRVTSSARAALTDRQNGCPRCVRIIDAERWERTVAEAGA